MRQSPLFHHHPRDHHDRQPATMSSVLSTPSKLTNPTSSASIHREHSPLCKHSPSATLDLLILIVVLFSGTFLLSSYFSYLFHSLSLLLSTLPLPYLLVFFAFFFLCLLLLLDFCCGQRSRRCDRLGCKGLKKALKFDLQLQTEESIRSAKDIDALPWKGGSESDPDYECIRAELWEVVREGSVAYQLSMKEFPILKSNDKPEMDLKKKEIDEEIGEGRSAKEI
ncbi:uncharacterized protein At5g19025-like [Tripterygium wilfordii]|uniref:uncharacterized protein At5g19025-like n=1 Tax=Tripterygium wilfordii TaxID=458696 RepID=UPI0018F7FEAA|nr:uncharacterized protein At5g19025-like [Tripterygium wilfordii]